MGNDTINIAECCNKSCGIQLKIMRNAAIKNNK